MTLSICASADPSKMLEHFPAAVAGTVQIFPPSVADLFSIIKNRASRSG
jgi:hypothetical protein